MQLTKRILNNHVSRRVVVLFITAAIVPLLLLAALTLYQIRYKLVDQYSEEIRLSSKMIGMEVFQRLQYTKEHLQLIASAYNAGHPLALDELLTPNRIESSRRIEALFRLDNQGNTTNLFGDNSSNGETLIREIHDQRIPGKSMIMVSHRSNFREDKGIYLIVPMDIKNPVGDLLVARLHVPTLFDTGQLDIRREQICILHENGVPLYCNKPYDIAWLSDIVTQTENNNSQQTTWKNSEGKETFTAYWSLFLAPHYQVEKWTVIAALPGEIALTSINQFQKIFLQVGFVTLGLVILLSIFSIRRSMVPLERLLNGTRQLSRGIFSTRVEIGGQDEFTELGDAFNDMATRLGNSFNQQANLIDFSYSLQHAGIVHKALKIALDALSQFVATDNMAIVHFENKQGLTHLTCLYRSNNQTLEHSASYPTSQLDLPLSPWKGPAEYAMKRLPIIQHFGYPEDTEISLMPALIKQHVEACLILELSASDSPGIDKLFILTQFSDILASTISNLKLNQQLEYQAYHDPLTKLPNRRLIKQETEKALRRAQQDQHEVAIMIMDIDRFKIINDSMGHAAGDELLVALAERLKQFTSRRDILCRFAGDEFVFLFASKNHDLRNKLPEIIERLDRVFHDHFNLGKRQVRITASKGIAVYPQDGESYLDLLKNADAAMYHAKHRKPGSYAFYNQTLQYSLIEEMETEQNLIEALTQKEFELYYQPCIHLPTGRAVGAEALIRWRRPKQGLITPDKFIRIAEQTGLIEPMGNWVLKQACKDFIRWRNEGVQLDYVSANVSSVQLQNPNFVETVAHTLEVTGMAAHHLELEITETAFIEDFEGSLAKLKEIQSLGVKVAVDDFGTGYASLKYLKEMPADRIKIDRLFIKDLPDSQNDIAIVSSLITLTDRLQLGLVAEGIETETQKQYLLDAGITMAQGFLMSRPLPESEFIIYLAENSMPDKIKRLPRKQSK
ncbi:MAG: EAL domain-containing protein [Candidatus Thiodiazotropha sp. (ex Monitilora ramsayi)]|nr:EAL domain-containing protein [Candidatus Thiodiazotropha sp. (ex Monitilora ramsayi)]